MNGTANGLVTEIAALLRDMGDDAQEVASVLEREGVRGSRDAAGNLNPVVRFIQNHRFIRRMEIEGRRTLRVEFSDGREETVDLPEAVRRFLTAFHQGAHPSLELEK